MPSIVQVKVSNVGTTVRGDKNMIEITGYDNTTNKNFKKAFFETTRDGARTKNADISDGLSPGDWVEVTMDDTSWKNVQFLKKIAEPAGGANTPSTPAPAAASGGGGGGQAKADKMTKAEWAAKDLKKEIAVARSVAVKTAAIMCNIEGKTASALAVKALEKLALRIEAYLMTGDFDADLAAAPAPEPEPTPEPADNQPSEQDVTGAPSAADDDIPF